MAKEQLKNIFLSASIPLKERDPKYFDSADIIAIRDSVILPNFQTRGLVKNKLTKFDYTNETKKTQILSRV